jgi:hypothetical protein
MALSTKSLDIYPELPHIINFSAESICLCLVDPNLGT